MKPLLSYILGGRPLKPHLRNIWSLLGKVSMFCAFTSPEKFSAVMESRSLFLLLLQIKCAIFSPLPQFSSDSDKDKPWIKAGPGFQLLSWYFFMSVLNVLFWDRASLVGRIERKGRHNWFITHLESTSKSWQIISCLEKSGCLVISGDDRLSKSIIDWSQVVSTRSPDMGWGRTPLVLSGFFCTDKVYFVFSYLPRAWSFLT